MMIIIDKTEEYRGREVRYWLESAEKEGKNVHVHYFYTDDTLTIKEICEGYSDDTQVHMFIASKRIRPKNGLKGIPR